MSRTLGITKGNFQWVNGVKDSTVIFYPDPKGRFKVSWVPPTNIQNKVVIKKVLNGLAMSTWVLLVVIVTIYQEQ